MTFKIKDSTHVSQLMGTDRQLQAVWLLVSWASPTTMLSDTSSDPEDGLSLKVLWLCRKLGVTSWMVSTAQLTNGNPWSRIAQLQLSIAEICGRRSCEIWGKMSWDVGKKALTLESSVVSRAGARCKSCRAMGTSRDITGCTLIWTFLTPPN